jgi:multidrug resistance efflux pump
MKSDPATAAATPNQLLEPVDRPPDQNGSPSPKSTQPTAPNSLAAKGPVSLPRAKGWSRRKKMLVFGGAGLVVLLVVTGVLLLIFNPLHKGRTDLVLHTVKYGRLELTIFERGALESGKNSDIYCRVKARSQGSTVATSIKNLIDDGSQVKGPRPDKPTGDLIVDLDDSGLQEQLRAEKITLDKAASDKIQAEETYKITVSQNDSDIKTAETKVELAIIDLMKYTGLEKAEVLKPATLDRLKADLRVAEANARRPAREIAEEDLKKFKTGDYLALLKDILGQIENATSDLSQQEDREAWAYRMMRKGYQTASQAQAETSRKESLQLTVNKTNLQLDVLVKYTKISQMTSYITALDEAQRTLERTKATAKSKEVQAQTDRLAKVSIWEQERAKFKDIEEEVKKCKIYAPQDGMVVYYIPEQARGGGGTQQAIVAQGEPVREGQKLMQIPDLAHMLVNTKVHEALVSRVHAGQPAQVRIESFPDKVLRGRVDSVATLAAQQDFFAADVKVYTTKVSINSDDIEGLNLKPGMSAAVTISVSDALEHVLAIPVQAIIGGPEMGANREVLVMTPDGPQERKIRLGASNQTMAEVREGLQEGDQVVLNPKAVLGDRIKTRQGVESGPQPASGSDSEGNPKAKGTSAKDGAQEKRKGGGGGGPDFKNMSDEEKQKARQKMQEAWQKASPEERKQMLQRIPEERREGMKARLKAQGIDIPD